MSVLAATPGDRGTKAYTCVFSALAGTLPNLVGVEQEDLGPRQGSDLCSSTVQQSEPSTKGQRLSGGVRPLIYVTLCKLQPTAFYTIPRVSAENGVSHNCIVCLEGT